MQGATDWLKLHTRATVVPMSPLDDSLRVLLVDAVEAARIRRSGQLERAGFAVRAATDAGRAIAVAHQWAPDVVLVALEQPGGSVAVARRLRHARALGDVPVLAYADGGVGTVDLTVGEAHDVVIRPHHDARLAAALA